MYNKSLGINEKFWTKLLYVTKNSVWSIVLNIIYRLDLLNFNISDY